jgi:hypothetical protein
MKTLHSETFTSAQLPALITWCGESVDKISAASCPLCDDWKALLQNRNLQLVKISNKPLYGTLEDFRRHLGRHMEQLALFSLPRQATSIERPTSHLPTDQMSKPTR